MSIRIVVITDVHANLPALKAVLEQVNKEGYDALYHTGDAVAIGPYPKESLELLLEIPNSSFLLGNHDGIYAHGLPDPLPPYIHKNEAEHQNWTRLQLGEGYRRIVADWPFLLQDKFEGVAASFMHYSLSDSEGDWFLPLVEEQMVSRYDDLFSAYHTELIFFGHQHVSCDLKGNKRYVNPGSLGCQKSARAPYVTCEFSNKKFEVKHQVAVYDDNDLFRAFEERKVPAKDFIYKAFYGGRFS
jgi:predicted phosphodiesterase